MLQRSKTITKQAARQQQQLVVLKQQVELANTYTSKQLFDLLTHLKTYPNENTYNRNIRYISRLITRKQLEKLKIDDIIKKTINPDAPENVFAENVSAAIDTEVVQLVQYAPNTLLIAECKGIINGEFERIVIPPPPGEPVPDDQTYNDYLHAFLELRVFTLKSYTNEYCPQGIQCPPFQTFQPDNAQPPPQLYDIGRYDSVPGEIYDQYKKYYEPTHFDTKCLLQAILYRISIPANTELALLITSYTHDPDPDDLLDEADRDIFQIYTVYGIVKRITAFIQTKNIADSMRYLTALKEWIAEEASQADNLEISQLLLKRIGIMTELLWHVLFKWPVRILDCPEIAPVIAPEIAPVIGPCNVKLYAGIGTQISDANYEIFVAGLFSGIDLPNCFHNQAPQYPPVPDQQIISRDFVSSAYSFDAAAKFCKILKCAQPGQTNIFCMLEFILLPGKQLPFIGSSANEAEVLLKPGNVYQFIKRYKVKYVRLSTRGEEPMIIYIYQFLLTDDQNTKLLGNNIPENIIPENIIHGTKKRNAIKISKNYFDYSSHPNWSKMINEFIDEFSRLAGIPLTHQLTDKVIRTAGSKRRSKRQTNKRRRRKTRKTRRRRTMKTRRRI